MTRRAFVGGALAASCGGASLAQNRPVKPRIAWVTASHEAGLEPVRGAFRAGLAEYHRREGQDIEVDYRFGNDDLARVPDLIDDVLKRPLSLVIIQGAAIYVLRERTFPAPVVFITSSDPVAAGLAESLAHPKPSMTGLTFMAAELNGKRIELMKEMVPDLRRIALVANPEHAGEELERAYSTEAGERLGLVVDYHRTTSAADLTRSFEQMSVNPPQAIAVFSDGFALQNRDRLAEFGLQRRIPVICGWSVFAESGALCSYGPRLTESYRRLAYYVDRILSGAKPGDLPIERPSVVELVINLKTANAMGLTIPISIMARADRVIE